MPATSYDTVPYGSHPFAQTHPNRLASVAALLGMPFPALVGCRILELGCASGGNLIPMAISLPGCAFLGVDNAERQIAAGQTVVRDLRLENVELRKMSILDVAPALGRFDFIIAHGIYSWVPPNVQQKILEICATNLVPNGIAYVSYNTYPGWHMRGMIRDMMLYHARKFAEPSAFVGQARGLLDFLAQAVAQENTPFSLMLKNEVAMLRRCTDSYLFHDHLEEHNEPVYFHQFVERARSHGLQYLGEADINVMVPGNFPPDVEQILQGLSQDIVQIEQYMDFVRNRTFRQTLLCCHKDIAPNYKLSPDLLAKFLIASPAKPDSPHPNIRSTDPERFQTPDGISLTSSDPLVKSAMVYLSEIFPQSAPFEQVRSIARKRLSATTLGDPKVVAADRENLGQAFLKFYTTVSAGLLELHVYQPPFMVEVSKTPRASPLARYQAATSNVVTSLRHEMVGLEEFDRQLLMLLDGSRNRAVLLNALVDLCRNGTLVAENDGKTLTDPRAITRLVQSALDQRLEWIARNALLLE